MLARKAGPALISPKSMNAKVAKARKVTLRKIELDGVQREF